MGPREPPVEGVFAFLASGGEYVTESFFEKVGAQSFGSVLAIQSSWWR